MSAAADSTMLRLRDLKGQAKARAMARASCAFSSPITCVQIDGAVIDAAANEVVFPDGERWPMRPKSMFEWTDEHMLFIGPFVLTVQYAAVGVRVDCMINTGQPQSASFKVGLYRDHETAYERAPLDWLKDMHTVLDSFEAKTKPR